MMADFCKACSEELFGEDFEELAGITTINGMKDNKYAVVICEGCGFIQVDNLGNCISKDCLKKNKHGYGILIEDKP